MMEFHLSASFQDFGIVHAASLLCYHDLLVHMNQM